MTENSDPLSWSKFFSGIGNIKNFAKIACSGINILLVALVIAGVMFIWSKFFPKKAAQVKQTQTGTLTIQPGANVQHLDFNSQETNTQRKVVGLEGSVSSKDAGIGFVKYINDNWAVVVGGKYSYTSKDGENKVVPEVKVRYDFN